MKSVRVIALIRSSSSETNKKYAKEDNIKMKEVSHVHERNSLLIVVTYYNKSSNCSFIRNY